MRIDAVKPVIETGGETTYEESFAIGNIGRIMGILRNSMYANPIKAIVREIASNARDAHREVGKDSKPIEIHLPNDFDEHFWIKDYGPGISPERMSNVFIRYGSSTKNDDNVQTGGFGLGAKTPFAYSDQFQITTITQSDTGNIKRVYIAYIDESETGKMRLMTQSQTDEETGTEVSLVVKEDDFYKFVNATLEICRYWNPLPVLKGRSIPKWPEENREAFLTTDEWVVYKSVDEYNHCNQDSVSVIIVDGICYPINPRNIDDCSNTISCSEDFVKLLNKGIKIFANTGDVSLSANREELQYDIKTQKFLTDKVNNVFLSVQESLIKNIHENSSYRNAVLFLHCFKRDFGFAIPGNFVPEWNGIKVINPIIKLHTNSKYVVDNFYFYKNRNYQNSLNKRAAETIVINLETIIVFNDLNANSISRSRVQHLIESGKCKLVTVVSFTDLNIEDGINALKDDIGVDPNLLEPIKLSSIVAPRKIGNRRGGRGSGRANYKAFVYDKSYTAYRGCDQYWRPTELDLEDGEGVYVVSSGRSNEISSQKLQLSPNFIDAVIDHVKDADLSIHAIREKDIGKLGEGWVPLKIWIETKIEEELNERNVTTKDILNGEKELGCPYGLKFNNLIQQDVLIMLRKLLKKHEKEMSPNSAMVQYFNYMIDLETKFSNNSSLNKILVCLGNCADDLDKLPLENYKNQFVQRYPLLTLLNRWAQIDVNHVFQYIQLIDAEYDRQNLDRASTDGYPMVANG